MPSIVFPTTSAPATRPQESGGRLINAYVEKTPYGAPSQIIVRRSPGLQRIATTAISGHTRGFLDAEAAAVWVLNNKLMRFDSVFTVTDLGTLVGTEPVTFGRNNAVVKQNVVVTENGCFNVDTSTGATPFVSVN